MSPTNPDQSQVFGVADRPLHVAQGEGQAGHGAIADSVLRDLQVANLTRAVIAGGLETRWELGALVGALLVGGKQR